MLSGETTNANFIVFGLTRSVLGPTIYRTRGEHANHYTTDEVLLERRVVNIDINATILSANLRLKTHLQCFCLINVAEIEYK